MAVRITAVYVHAGGPSPEVAVVQGAADGVGAGAGGIAADGPAASESALPNVSCSHAIWSSENGGGVAIVARRKTLFQKASLARSN